MQEKLISSLDTNELAGTIASIKITPPSLSSKTTLDDANGTELPPIQPGPRKPRRLSRGGTEEGGPSDKIDIDSENIETPPVTRRAYGSRPFTSATSTSTTSSTGGAPTEVSSSSSSSSSSTTVQGTGRNNNSSNKAEDDELGDGRFDRFSSVRRTRRLRKAPEGAEEDMEPRKSPEGVEDLQPDVIIGMEVKKVKQTSDACLK